LVGLAKEEKEVETRGAWVWDIYASTRHNFRQLTVVQSCPWQYGVSVRGWS